MLHDQCTLTERSLNSWLAGPEPIDAIRKMEIMPSNASPAEARESSEPFVHPQKTES